MLALLSMILILLVCALTVLQLSRGLKRSDAIVASVVLLGIVAGLPGMLLSPVLRESPAGADLSRASYQTSLSCRKCHAEQYESWHHTFHRTMTQDALPEKVLGDFDDVSVTFNGLQCRLSHDSGRFSMNLVNPRWESLTLQAGRKPRDEPAPPRVTYAVDRLVGSHNMQVYLTKFPNGQFQVLPLVWHVGEDRWINRGGGFLRSEPDHLYTDATPWNTNCAFCHNTKTNPGVSAGSSLPGNPTPNQRMFDTRFAEMGIACESCHGPGEPHVAANQNPARRYFLAQTGKPDPTIVNPAHLPKEQAIEVCGRCHGKWRVKPEFTQQVAVQGDLFIPGSERLGVHYEHGFAFFDDADKSAEPDPNYFWPDWTPRPSALEYQGMLLSPCHQRGELTCTSCHSMHKAISPDDQLIFPHTDRTSPAVTNRACIECHEEFTTASAVAEHTHHSTNSRGSNCYNCHMPFQSYGLLKVIRTHRIASPNAAVSAETGLPNACNQCHIDRSLQWTAEWLGNWYRHSMPDLSEDQKKLSVTLIDLYAGHALSRALAASRLGWSASREAAPGDWPIVFLTDALEDSYAAVRLIAYQSLRQFRSFEDLEFDYLADPNVRREQIEEARRRGKRVNPMPPEEVPQAVPLQTNGEPLPGILERLLDIQDQTEIVIFE